MTRSPKLQKQKDDLLPTLGHHASVLLAVDIINGHRVCVVFERMTDADLQAGSPEYRLMNCRRDSTNEDFDWQLDWATDWSNDIHDALGPINTNFLVFPQG